MDLFRKYLLASTALFAPPNEGVEGNEGETDGLEGEGADEGREVAEGQDADEGHQGDGEGVDEEGQEDEVDAAPPKKGRANETIRELRARVQQESTERQRIDRELAELRAAERQRQQANQQETPEAKATRRALMDPMDVMREDLRESEQRTQTLLAQQAMATQETQDKLLYNSILRDAPHLKKYDSEVERIRLEQQSQGRFVPREVLLDLAIGRAARAAAVKAGAKPKAQGQARVAAQQSRTVRAGGDTATQRGRQGDSVEKRLENVPI